MQVRLCTSLFYALMMSTIPFKIIASPMSVVEMGVCRCMQEEHDVDEGSGCMYLLWKKLERDSK